VRELENMVERAVVLTRGDYLSMEDFSVFAAAERTVTDGGMKQVVETAERKMILEALVGAGWVQTRAASALGISERMLRYKMKKLGISKEGMH
jgi:two-component system, NtrC family, response regulator AtoC